MKTKFLLPAMAMFFAIGMSFATGNTEVDPIWDYVDTDNGVVRISEVQDCGSQLDQCSGRLQPGGAAHPIFDDMNLTTPKLGGSVIDLY